MRVWQFVVDVVAEQPRPETPSVFLRASDAACIGIAMPCGDFVAGDSCCEEFLAALVGHRAVREYGYYGLLGGGHRGPFD
jgi:hypothetical protein